MSQNIGPCDCCGSSSSTTGTSTEEPTTGTGTPTTGTGTSTEEPTTGTGTGTGTSTTGTGTGTCDDCCYGSDWEDQNLVVDVTLDNPDSCDCDVDVVGGTMVQAGPGGFCEWSNSFELCNGMSLDLFLYSPCSPSNTNPGFWSLDWTLRSNEPDCGASGSATSATGDCTDTVLDVCFGPIGGVDADACCDEDGDGSGGTGSGSWEICFSTV